MKQNTMIFLSSLAIYALSCLVCTLIFSLFYYFKVMPLSVYTNTLYVLSLMIAILLCIQLIKRIEKKTLFYILAFLLILLLASCLASFSFLSILKASIRFFICFTISFIVFMKK
ncbi:MAG: hypothetical protein EOM11_06625 [Erysipelotrichia bacterium]|nr:hypothetical protein [Erysipelotrichia bacterium]